MTLILGFGSKARVGKDSCGNAIIDYFNTKNLQAQFHYGNKAKLTIAKIYKFAAAIYKLCEEEYGMKSKDAPLLQRVGTEYRDRDQNYWVDKVFDQIKREKPDVAIITDVRYKNEAGRIKSEGGYVIGVTRLNRGGTRFVADDRPVDHPSEVDLDDWDFDYNLVAHSDEVGYLGELAITTTEFIRALK